MVAGRPSPAPLGPVYPAGSALGGGWGLLWPYRSRVVRWCLDAVIARLRRRGVSSDLALEIRHRPLYRTKEAAASSSPAP